MSDAQQGQGQTKAVGRGFSSQIRIKSLPACIRLVCHLCTELFPPTTSHCLKAESTPETGLEGYRD